MAHEFLTEEEVTAPNLELYLIFEGLTVVSAYIHFPFCCFANPRGVLNIVNKAEGIGNPEYGESIINGLDLIDPNEVVVVSVLLAVQLELRMKRLVCFERFHLQVFSRELHSLLQRVQREVEG